MIFKRKKKTDYKYYFIIEKNTKKFIKIKTKINIVYKEK